jgi:hypothetical protein
VEPDRCALRHGECERCSRGHHLGASERVVRTLGPHDPWTRIARGQGDRPGRWHARRRCRNADRCAHRCAHRRSERHLGRIRPRLLLLLARERNRSSASITSVHLWNDMRGRLAADFESPRGFQLAQP